MGTRADFYVGTGKDAEWLGSIAWDGYEVDENEDHPIAKAKTETAYRKAVKDMLSSRDYATHPEQGWPWPWKDAQDYPNDLYVSIGAIESFGILK